jgi:excisionase family DNA binding protein
MSRKPNTQRLGDSAADVGMQPRVGSCKIYSGRMVSRKMLRRGTCACMPTCRQMRRRIAGLSGRDPPIAHWGARPVDVANEVDWVASIGRDTARAAELSGGDMAARPATGTTKFLGVDEAAELLSISKRTIYGWVQQGRIPYRKAGRRVLFLESELLEWTKPDGRRQYLELIR